MADYGEYGDFEDFEWAMQELAEEVEKKKHIETDGIIFDIDGTLWDSRREVGEAWNQAIKEKSNLPVRVDLPSLKQLFGKPMNEIANLLFPDLDPSSRDELTQYLFTYEIEHLRKYPSTLYNGVADTLNALSKKYNLFIVSNCQCGYIEVCIESTGIASFFTDFACFGDTQKPKSETLKLIIERNNLKKPVYVGDTLGDETACKEAGIPIIYASYGFGQVEKPIATIFHFKDLLDLF